MPLPPTVPHIVGDDDFDENAPMLPATQPETESLESDSSKNDDDDVTGEDSSSSDGTDWSMNVTQIPGTPGRIPILACADSTPEIAIVVDGRVQSPILACEDTGVQRPEMEVEVEAQESSLLSFLNLQPTSQATNMEIGMTVGDPEAQEAASTPPRDYPPPKPRSSRNLRNIRSAQSPLERTLRSNSKTMAEGGVERGGRFVRKNLRGVSKTALAKPIDITAYFHEVSANLVRKRIRLHSYLFLRDHIDSLLVQVFKDYNLIPKSGLLVY